MSFDRIDRRFAPRAKPGLVRLECVGCGGTEDVEMLYPLWPRVPPEPVALCRPCSRLVEPPAESAAVPIVGDAAK